MPPPNQPAGFRPIQFDAFRSDRSNDVRAAAFRAPVHHRFDRRFMPYAHDWNYRNAAPSNDNMTARAFWAEQHLADVRPLSQNPSHSEANRAHSGFISC